MLDLFLILQLNQLFKPDLLEKNNELLSIFFLYNDELYFKVDDFYFNVIGKLFQEKNLLKVCLR
jgi:hypothetical protein